MPTKYDTQLNELRAKLAPLNRVLVVLPSDINTDKLAAALSLYLSLKQSGKQASIVSNGTLKVNDSNLFGIGDIKDTFPKAEGGNLTISLENVVDNEGKIVSLEKLDWFPQGSSLNLVFHVLPGQKFEPTNIQVKRDASDFEAIFVIGAANLSEVGNLYIQNTDQFSKGLKINIDNNSSNNPFGEINIIDPNSPSLSEMMIQIITGLGFSIDSEIASNIIAGIYEATGSLTKNTNPETFLSVGVAMQAGGKIPQITESSQNLPNTLTPTFDPKIFMQQPSQAESQAQFQSVFNISMPTPPEAATSSNEAGENQEEQKTEEVAKQEDQTSKTREEKPAGEFAVSSSMEGEKPTPDWLTPKIYKGGSMG
jgi:nanoRNase/pAp phosphatase (c-di-AMP/oligoRNAs hydrolase)